MNRFLKKKTTNCGHGYRHRTIQCYKAFQVARITNHIPTVKVQRCLWPIPTSTGGALAMRRSKCRKSHCTQDGGSTMLGNKGLKSDRCLLFCSPAWGCLADSAIVSGILRDWSLHRVSAWMLVSLLALFRKMRPGQSGSWGLPATVIL